MQSPSPSNTPLHSTPQVLPHLARMLLVATFLEDGIRMWTQWTEQREYIMILWGCGHLLASIFVFINLVGQIGAVSMVVNRFQVNPTLALTAVPWKDSSWNLPGSQCLLCVFQINVACGILLFIVALQTIAFSILTDPMFLLRNLALCGAVLLVAAEDWVEDKSTFAGVT